MDFRRFLTIERIAFGLTACGSIAIGLLDFFNVLGWEVATLAKAALVALGVLMITVVAEAVKREETLERIEQRLNGAVLRYLNMGSEVPKAFKRKAQTADAYIHEAVLAWKHPNNQQGRDDYRTTRDQRVINREISLRQIVVIHHKQHFCEILSMLARFKDNDQYELGYFEPAADPWFPPMMGYWSFDDGDIYLGSFTVDKGPPKDQMLHTSDPTLNEWLARYWDALWRCSTAIKRGCEVEHSALEHIAERLGITSDEYRALMARYQRAAGTGGRWEDAQLVESSESGWTRDSVREEPAGR